MTPQPTTDLSSEESAPDDLEVLQLRPAREHTNLRLDRFVASRLPELSRGHVQRLIESGDIVVDGLVRRPAFKMTPGEVVSVVVPPAIESSIEPEPIPLAVVYEDEDVLIVDKVAGMVVHPAPGHHHGTLANAVLAHVPNLSVGGSQRPGIVHRLDKDTSGLIVVAKSDRAHLSLVRQWQERTVEKRYLALVAGTLHDDEATVDAPVARDPKNRLRMAVIRGGRAAVSHLQVLARPATATLLDVQIETGRTHQIRVHLAFIGHPVAGDLLYGNSHSDALALAIDLSRHFLHARTLEFDLPTGERRCFAAPLPADLHRALDQLGLPDGAVDGVC